MTSRPGLKNDRKRDVPFIHHRTLRFPVSAIHTLTSHYVRQEKRNPSPAPPDARFTGLRVTVRSRVRSLTHYRNFDERQKESR